MENKENQIALVDFDPKKNQILELWFHDAVEFGHGCRVSIKIKNVLCLYRSEYQEIAVFETEKLGRMLVLDGITMLTEFDEFAYHEMIVHVPLLTHPNPARVLIIGGGDGGTVREVLRHPEVEKVHVCELDREVVRACRQYLPSLASSFDDPKVEIFYEDGAKFVEKNPSTYDIIIVDSTDPIGPGQILFQRKFYEDMKKSLKPDGIVVTQCECLFLHKHVIGAVASFAKEIYPITKYYLTNVPTYPSGLIGFMFCSNKYNPLKDFSLERAQKLPNLRYYTPALHQASFVLPKFGEEIIQSA